MTITFKVLSHLLSYPSEELRAAGPELKDALATENLVPPTERAALDKLIDTLTTEDLIDLQERYVLLFDRTRALSLHLFEHIHGESRDRGQAMADLLGLYEEHGLSVDKRELPDYLPMFLEFLSTMPLDQALEFLAQPLHVVAAVEERLSKRDTPYHSVFAALLSISHGAKIDAEVLAELTAQPDDDPNDLAALDQTWEDAEVTFGPGADGMTAPGGQCPAARATLAGMDPNSENHTAPPPDGN